MNGSFHRRLWVLLVSAAAAYGVWQYEPSTELDRRAFTVVAGGFINPPWFVTGQGAPTAPWTVRTFSMETMADRRQVPAVVSLGDDAEGVFQKSPPAPIDLAVVLANFQRLGKNHAATAAVLAWPTPDPIGLAALEKTLARFDSLVMAAPLSRGAVSEALPPAFRRASLPLTAVLGNSSYLPIVNRVPLPGVVLAGEKTLAGFSMLESETQGHFEPLLARWEDRVVCAMPLLAVLQRLHLPLNGLEIRPGAYLKLSPAGPIVPLDLYGRLSVPLKPINAFAEISAASLIDAQPGIFPSQAPDPLILRDDQSAAEPSTRAFSENLSALVAALASDSGLGQPRAYPRPSAGAELAILVGLVLALTLLAGLADYGRNLSFMLLAGACLSTQWLAVGMASLWLPGIPALAAISAAFVMARLIGKSALKPVPETAVTAATSPIPLETELTPKPKKTSTPSTKTKPAISTEVSAPAPREKKPPAAKPPAKKRAPRRKK